MLLAAYALCAFVIFSGSHGHDEAISAVIGMTAVLAGIMPVRVAADRTAVGLFQSAWIGSILHLTVFLALGAAVIFSLKPPTAFVMWLLLMYWLTLAGLCITFVRAMRTVVPQNGKLATKGE